MDADARGRTLTKADEALPTALADRFNACAAAKITAAYGIYDGERERLDAPVHVLPVKKFLKELWAGNIIP